MTPPPPGFLQHIKASKRFGLCYCGNREYSSRVFFTVRMETLLELCGDLVHILKHLSFLVDDDGFATVVVNKPSSLTAASAAVCGESSSFHKAAGQLGPDWNIAHDTHSNSASSNFIICALLGPFVSRVRLDFSQPPPPPSPSFCYAGKVVC